jgi:hypothetical protein
MAGNKTSTNKPSNWGKLGGGGKMHGFDGTGTQKPGGSSQEGSGSKRGIEPKAGGAVGFYSASGNKSYAGTQTPGQSAATPSGGNDKFAKGGSTKMFGHTGSQRVEGGRTAK